MTVGLNTGAPVNFQGKAKQAEGKNKHTKAKVAAGVIATAAVATTVAAAVIGKKSFNAQGISPKGFGANVFQAVGSYVQKGFEEIPKMIKGFATKAANTAGEKVSGKVEEAKFFIDGSGGIGKTVLNALNTARVGITNKALDAVDFVQDLTGKIQK